MRRKKKKKEPTKVDSVRFMLGHSITIAIHTVWKLLLFAALLCGWLLNAVGANLTRILPLHTAYLAPWL